MNSPELPDKLDPTIYHSLFELNGTTYKNRSHSAAAKRAAYHKAMSSKNLAKFSASSSNATTHEQTLSASSPCASFRQCDDFSNYGTAPGYTAEYGNQGPGQEGWIMHSQGSDSGSRLRYNFLFNDGSTPFTFIRAWMRGAPNNGKNSFVCLREERCADDPSQKGCDEVDIVEYYGYPSDPQSQWAIYQKNNGQVGWHRYSAKGTNPGLDVYSYSVYLENDNYIELVFFGPDGSSLYEWGRNASQGYVPTQAMYLYAGIWDCSSIDSGHTFCDDGSGPFNGDSWLALRALGITTQPLE